MLQAPEHSGPASDQGLGKLAVRCGAFLPLVVFPGVAALIGVCLTSTLEFSGLTSTVPTLKCEGFVKTGPGGGEGPLLQSSRRAACTLVSFPVRYRDMRTIVVT